MTNQRSRHVVAAAMWLGVAAIAAALLVQRFRAATAQGQPDLGEFFLPAAAAIAAGGSPYSVEGYYYSPVVALLLLPVADGTYAIEYWTVLRLAFGVGACVLAGIAFTPRGATVRRGLVTAIALVTLLWSWPTTVDLWLGQIQLIVLAALITTAFLESRGHSFAAGFALGSAAVVKTWPALFAIWLLRRQARDRARQWLGLAAAAAVAVAIALIVTGPAGVAAMVSAPFGGADQELAANSVWGVGKLLFSTTPIGDPLLESAALRWVTSGILLVVVLGLVATILARPGDGTISLFNCVLAVILLLPVSHFVYLILALPILWWWVARLFEHPRSVGHWAIVTVLTIWWGLCFRVTPEGDGLASTDWPSLLLVFGSSMVALATSVAGAAVMRQPKPVS